MPRTEVVFCTVAGDRDAAGARVLRDSLARHRPGSALRIFERSKGLTVASALRQALTQCEAAVFFEPTLALYAGIDDLAALAVAHDVLLVPRVLEPLPLDGYAPTEPDLQEQGIHASGAVAVRHSAGDFLEWWDEHARRDPIRAWRWLDLVPSYFDHGTARDRGHCVADWNLHERPLASDAGRLVVDGTPLRSFNFRESRYASRRPPRAWSPRFPLAQALRRDYGKSLTRVAAQ